MYAQLGASLPAATQYMVSISEWVSSHFGGILFSIYRKIALQLFMWLFFIAGFWLWIIGRPSFHIGASGHEAAELAAANAINPKIDYSYPYYREQAFCIGVGMTFVWFYGWHYSGNFLQK